MAECDTLLFLGADLFFFTFDLGLLIFDFDDSELIISLLVDWSEKLSVDGLTV